LGEEEPHAGERDYALSVSPCGLTAPPAGKPGDATERAFSNSTKEYKSNHYRGGSGLYPIRFSRYICYIQGGFYEREAVVIDLHDF